MCCHDLFIISDCCCCCCSHDSLFAGRMPFLPPNQQHQSTEGWNISNCKLNSGRGLNCKNFNCKNVSDNVKHACVGHKIKSGGNSPGLFYWRCCVDMWLFLLVTMSIAVLRLFPTKSLGVNRCAQPLTDDEVEVGKVVYLAILLVFASVTDSPT